MKKIFGLLVLALSLQSCDDGDLQLETFNFDNETVQKCNTLLYVTSGSEIMILEIGSETDFNTLFAQEPTPANQPILYTLKSSDKLLYRLYDGAVNSTLICSSVPPASPVVIDEYIANPGGQIQVTTNVLTDVNETSKSTKITYTHQIKLINCQFVNGENVLNYSEFLFGNYSSQTNTMSYSFTTTSSSCNPNTIYRNNSMQALLLDFSTYTYPTTTGTTTVALDSNNRVISRLYSGGSLNNSSICASTPPDPLVITEEWVAESGTAEITTTLIDINGVTNYEHNIVLLNCNYVKDDLSYFHDQFNFGTYITN